MFKKELLICLLLASVVANNTNNIGFNKDKNIIYQEYKNICYQEIYYLNNLDEIMFNVDNIDMIFKNYLNDYKNVSIIDISYVKQDNYIYPTYSNELTYKLNYFIGFKEYKFELISSLSKRR